MSDHIADASKMLPTPETDAVVFDDPLFANGAVCADFARKLERQRDEARAVLREIAGMDTSQLASPQQCGAVALAADFLKKLEAAK